MRAAEAAAAAVTSKASEVAEKARAFAVQMERTARGAADDIAREARERAALLVRRRAVNARVAVFVLLAARRRRQQVCEPDVGGDDARFDARFGDLQHDSAVWRECLRARSAGIARREAELDIRRAAAVAREAKAADVLRQTQDLQLRATRHERWARLRAGCIRMGAANRRNVRPL